MTNERTISPEKQKLINKLKKSIETIEEMLNELGSLLTDEEKKDLRIRRENARDLKDKLETDKFEIAIIGTEKAGKSTFANALMNANLLPAYDPRCTYTSTKIGYSKENNTIITFYNEDEFDDYIRGMLQTLGFSNYKDFYFIKNRGLSLNGELLSEDDFLNEYDKELRNGNILSAIDKLYGNSMKQEICNIIKYAVSDENNTETKGDSISRWLGTGRKEISDNGDKKKYKETLQNYIANAWNALAVKEVLVNSNELGEEMRNAVIYDVPGFDSPTAKHKEQTLKRMQNADAVIIIANAQKPDNTKASLDLLDEYDNDGNPLKNKLFVFVNRIEDAADVETSKDAIVKNWGKYCKDGNRILYGSALSYLQKNNLISEEDKVVNALERFEKNESRFPNGFGIKEIHEKLKLYNINERPAQLLLRTNNIMAGITTVLSNFRNRFNGEDLDISSFSPEHIQLATKFLDDTRNLLTGDGGTLKILRQKMKKEMIDNDLPVDQRPLSKQIVDYIEKNVTVEKYKITDEEIEKAKLENGYVEGKMATIELELPIRTHKFDKMWEDFSKNVINIADKHHAEYAQEIIDTILKALKVTENHPKYQEIKERVNKELLPYRHELTGEADEYSGMYYATLIERFARDIYEILIRKPYTKDRFDRFAASKRNFFSMSVFYNPQNEKDDSFINTPPQDQPLCKMLLFHSYLNMDQKITELNDGICRYAFLKELAASTKKLARMAFFAMRGDVPAILGEIADAFATIGKDKTDEFRIGRVETKLKEISDRNKPCDMADIENFRQYYTNYFMSIPDTEENFTTEFNKDIEILKDVLTHAFIYAIEMEKPFVAREEKTMDDIIDYIKKSETFRVFMTNPNNIRDILYNDFEAIETERKEKENRKRFCDLANKLNSTLNQE